MKKLLFFLLCLPLMGLAQFTFLEPLTNNEIYYDSTNGGIWDWNNEESYVNFSTYDIATGQLSTTMLDSTIITLSEDNPIISFDPTTQTIYCYEDNNEEIDSTIYIYGIDVVSGQVSKIAINGLFNSVNTVTPPNPQHGDIFQNQWKENSLFTYCYELPNDSLMNITECDTYTWNGTTHTTTGTYTYTTTNAIGLDSTITLDLTINLVIASISQSGDNLSAVTTPIGINANWYNIQTEDSTTRIWLMEEDAPSFNPTFDCSYFIIVSDNGCTDTSEIYAYGENAARIGSFITSPNPTTGLINVKFDNSKNQFVMVELISNNGSKLDEFITIENNLDIDLSKYPSGSYYLYFNSEDAVQGCRLEEVQKLSTKIILNK